MRLKYFRRIGAVAEGGGIYSVQQDYDKLRVEVLSDGTVNHSEEVPAPTEEELAEIKKNIERIRALVVPVHPVPPGVGLPKIDGKQITGTVHQYKNAKDGLIFLVQRIEYIDKHGDPEKRCVPWIWDGSSWIQQSWPGDVPCPLYGNWHGRDRILVHEGEKAVDAAIAACAHDSTHPWRHWLRRFGHCTWRAGTRAVHLADWGSLPEKCEVWIMPDNDEPGYQAARQVAEQISTEIPRCKGIWLYHHRGNEAPKSWDMADEPFPSTVPELELGFEFALPAITWVMMGTKLVPKVRKSFVQQFAYCKATDEFVLVRDPRIFYKSPHLNSAFAHLSSGQTLSKLMLESPDLPRRAAPSYRPGGSLNPGTDLWKPHNQFFNDIQGLDVVNAYIPPFLHERKPGSLAEIKPLLVMMRNLVPNPIERKILYRWTACMIAGKRLKWSPLLISKLEGTGKSTYARTVMNLVGQHNAKLLQSSVLQDRFTSWALNRQLIVVPELKEGSGFQLAEYLKVFIDDDLVPIRRMNVDFYDVESHLSFIFSSNHPDCVALSQEDRRWFLPKVTESHPPHDGELYPFPKLRELARRYLGVGKNEDDTAFFAEYTRWKDAHLGEMLYLARRYGTRLVERGWNQAHSRAPVTIVKQFLQDSSIPDWVMVLRDHLEDAEVVLDDDLMEYLRERNVRWMPRKASLDATLKTMGWELQFSDPKSTNSQARRGVLKLVYSNGVQLRSRVFAKVAALPPQMPWLPEEWRKSKDNLTLLSSKWRDAFGMSAF